VRLRAGEDRVLVMNTLLGDSLEDAKAMARPGHDELRKLIWPNTVKVNPDLRGKQPPSLEESMEAGQYVVGATGAVRDELLDWCQELGVEYLTIFPHFPGMTQRDTLDQLERFSRDVRPALSGELATATAC
jgi:hypothetical protein